MKKVLEKVAAALVLTGTLLAVSPSKTIVSALSEGEVISETNNIQDDYATPAIVGNMTYGFVYTGSVTPNFRCENGELSMKLNGEPFSGGTITTVGTHYLSVTGTTPNGRSTTINLMFKIAGIVDSKLSVDELVNIITKSSGDELMLGIEEDNYVIDKRVFEAMKKANKNVLFTLPNNVQWYFKAEDIKEDKICDLNTGVEFEIKNKEIDDAIKRADKDAVVVHFDHHGQLPGKATVRLYSTDFYTLGDEATLYYFNDVTNKIEKIKDNIQVDGNFQVSMEIEHCSDYFLSKNKNIQEGPWITTTPSVDNITTGNVENTLVDAAEKENLETIVSNSESVKTGDNRYIVLFTAFVSAAACILSRKNMVSKNN